MSDGKTILVAPLHWGLGHATRCIPLIQMLLIHKFKVMIASDGAALRLLQKEFPDLPSIELPSYNIRYSKKGRNLKWTFLKKAPELLKVISQEKKVIEDLVNKGKINGIISDNRFGVHSYRVPSVYMTHQLNVLSGITTKLSTKKHQKIINKYDECWVPDNEGSQNLSGKLGHGQKLKSPVKYIGALSRMNKKDLPIKYDILILLSGPEPQRIILEKLMIEQFQDKPLNTLLIQGIVDPVQSRHSIGNIEAVNFLLKDELETVLNQSQLVISRSGYTTLMDFSILEKKVFFIPTPGQYEQEYLAERCFELGLAPYCKQANFRYKMVDEALNFKRMKGVQEKIDLKNLFSLFESK